MPYVHVTVRPVGYEHHELTYGEEVMVDELARSLNELGPQRYEIQVEILGFRRERRARRGGSSHGSEIPEVNIVLVDPRSP